MNRLFRKYHRILALIISLPLLLTVLSGIGYVVLDEWLHIDRSGSVMMKLHTMEFLGLETIYPALVGLGSIGLLVTGASLMGWFRRSKSLDIN
jgi:uncharacterized iron-regulated membrane protein